MGRIRRTDSKTSRRLSQKVQDNLRKVNWDPEDKASKSSWRQSPKSSTGWPRIAWRNSCNFLEHVQVVKSQGRWLIDFRFASIHQVGSIRPGRRTGSIRVICHTGYWYWIAFRVVLPVQFVRAESICPCRHARSILLSDRFNSSKSLRRVIEKPVW